MSEPPFRLATCPIVEAVIDIRCDMPSAFNLATLEGAARDLYRDRYPKFRPQFIDEHRLELHGDESPKFSARRGLGAFQFLQDDERQLVQVRAQGFSLNRLAPYTSLDDYLPEFERTWRLFVDLAAPVQVREIHLRYINRLLLPTENGRLEFTDFLKVSPRLPDEEKLQTIGFFDQHAAVEVTTGHQVTLS